LGDRAGLWLLAGVMEMSERATYCLKAGPGTGAAHAGQLPPQRRWAGLSAMHPGASRREWPGHPTFKAGLPDLEYSFISLLRKPAGRILDICCGLVTSMCRARLSCFPAVFLLSIVALLLPSSLPAQPLGE
jgi:hypothetical protein